MSTLRYQANKILADRNRNSNATNRTDSPTENTSTPKEPPPPYVALDPPTRGLAFDCLRWAMADSHGSQSSQTTSPHSHRNGWPTHVSNNGSHSLYSHLPSHTFIDDTMNAHNFDENMEDDECDPDCECQEEKQANEPNTLHIDASTTVSGAGNVVHADAIAAVGARVASAVASILKQPYQAHGDQTTQTDDCGTILDPKPVNLNARPLRISLNLGVRVSGTRNVVASSSTPVRMMPVPNSGSATSQAAAFPTVGKGHAAEATASGPAPASPTTQGGQKEAGQKRKAPVEDEDERDASTGSSSTMTKIPLPFPSNAQLWGLDKAAEYHGRQGNHSARSTKRSKSADSSHSQ